jgi:hypothetical protein
VHRGIVRTPVTATFTGNLTGLFTASAAFVAA